MNRNFVVMASLALVVVMFGFVAAGSVFAQDPTATPAPAAPGPMGPRMGMFGASEAITELLGVTPGQLLDARLEGKSLLDVAKEKGITEQQLVDAMVAERKTALDQAVTDGDLTQEQADWMLARMKAVAPFALTNPFAGKQGWQRGMGMGKGMGMDDDCGMMGRMGQKGERPEGWRGMMRGQRFGDGQGRGWRWNDDQGGGRGMGRWGNPAPEANPPATPGTSS